MKRTIFLIVNMCGLLCASCGDNTKPTVRNGVWGSDKTETVIGDAELSEEKVLVPFNKMQSGLAEVQVSLNGVPFNMWWDTGASMTCISLLELQKLIKENRISPDDYVGPAMSKIADGSTTETAIFTIKEIYIQGQDNKYLILRDVRAMVSPSIEAPLLIGQNVISNLPKHFFNESMGVIEFEQ